MTCSWGELSEKIHGGIPSYHLSGFPVSENRRASHAFFIILHHSSTSLPVVVGNPAFLEPILKRRFPSMGVPQNRWFRMTNPIEMDDE